MDDAQAEGWREPTHSTIEFVIGRAGLTQLANSAATADQCQNALARFVKPDRFRVILLDGDGHAPQLESDADLVRARTVRRSGGPTYQGPAVPAMVAVPTTAPGGAVAGSTWRRSPPLGP